MSVLNKMMSIIGLDEEEDLDEEYMEEEYEEKEEIEAPLNKRANRSNVVELNPGSPQATKVIISRPKNYDEATTIVDDLKSKRIIMINISDLEPKIAQRLLDFISGSCYSLNGDLQEVDKNVFVLLPHNVEVSKEITKELSSKSLFKF